MRQSLSNSKLWLHPSHTAIRTTLAYTNTDSTVTVWSIETVPLADIPINADVSTLSLPRLSACILVAHNSYSLLPDDGQEEPPHAAMHLTPVTTEEPNINSACHLCRTISPYSHVVDHINTKQLCRSSNDTEKTSDRRSTAIMHEHSACTNVSMPAVALSPCSIDRFSLRLLRSAVADGIESDSHATVHRLKEALGDQL